MYFSIKKPRTIDEFEAGKPKAIDLEACVTKSLTGPADIAKEKWQVLRDRPVAEMALTWMTLLGYR